MIPLPYEIPEDFQEFWRETTTEAMNYPLKVSTFRVQPGQSLTHQVEAFSFEGIDGRNRYGWLAYPEGARRLPGFLWVPPYGREAKLPDVYGTREGMVSMSFNLHGEGAFHQEKYVVERGYFSNGAEDPSSWVFRTMFQNAVIALRILRTQIQIDEDRIGVSGMSQGGGMSIWLGAWCPLIKAVCADMPFLSTIGNTIINTAYRYPLKEVRDYMDSIPIGQERVLNTLSYFDTFFQAQYCQVPTHVSLGLKDPACRPETVRAAFDQLPGTKRLEVIDWGHDWHPSMIENNLKWFSSNL
jgi:cephalosporin-C deacetylase